MVPKVHFSVLVLVYSTKIKKEWTKKYFFVKNPGIFRLVTLTLEIPDKSKLHPWKFHKIVLQTVLEIPTSKISASENSI